MAVDNTPPRIKLIATIAVITVITLIAINFVTESYYAMMTDQAQREKLAPTRDKDELHKAEALAFANAAVPIDKAMSEIAKGDRAAVIAPQQSDDLGAMTGWTKLPKPAPTAHAAGAAPATTDGAAADAGAPLASDGGAVVPALVDAGAVRATPAATPADGGAAHASAAATDAGAHADHH